MDPKSRQFDRSSYSFIDHPEKALADYLELGYHIEYNVYSPEECQVLIDAAHELENAKNQTYRPCMMPHKEKDIFLKMMKNTLIVNTMSNLVGGNAMGLQSEFFYCKPGTRGFSLHQDNFYVEAEYGVFASAWIALTDTYPEKGGLIIYPQSHKAGTLPVAKLNLIPDQAQDPNANNEETIIPGEYKRYNIAIPKGAALFIHGHLVHGSNVNATTDWRYVLLCTYIKAGENFRSGHYAKREEVAVR